MDVGGAKMLNCHNCMEVDRKKCFPAKKLECRLFLPIGWQMVDNERKLAGLYNVMAALNLRIETYPNGDFAIVRGGSDGN